MKPDMKQVDEEFRRRQIEEGHRMVERFLIWVVALLITFAAMNWLPGGAS